MGHPGLFFFIFVFLIHSWQQTNVQYKYFFANDWIRTVDLWNWKQPLFQLSHNHCPYHLDLVLKYSEIEFKV